MGQWRLRKTEQRILWRNNRDGRRTAVAAERGPENYTSIYSEKANYAEEIKEKLHGHERELMTMGK